MMRRENGFTNCAMRMIGGEKMTDNKYWVFLENLRRSGVCNMYGAAPYIQEVFGVSKHEAKTILLDWMKKYNADDYKGMK